MLKHCVNTTTGKLYGDEHEFAFYDPRSLQLIVPKLQDRSYTGEAFTIKGHSFYDRHGEHIIPKHLQDPKKRKANHEERVCDQAALVLNRFVTGLPVFHPLFIDSESRLDRYRELTKIYSFRNTKKWEEFLFGDSFIIDIPALKRPATAADVTAGRALFWREKSKVAAFKGTQVLVFKAELKRLRRLWRCSHYVIAQAEVDDQGRLTYGLIGTKGIKVALASELQAFDLKTWKERTRPHRGG